MLSKLYLSSSMVYQKSFSKMSPVFRENANNRHNFFSIIEISQISIIEQNITNHSKSCSNYNSRCKNIFSGKMFSMKRPQLSEITKMITIITPYIICGGFELVIGDQYLFLVLDTVLKE